ncbi:hypothetical protein SAMN04488037_10358 [Shimia marina]|uniref:Uncharacterized protein n=1 Tax=Shimia marina TaxID=321267 RepID=A0A0P1ER73_9RHOB|nr:hypothetical protein SHM7688_02253 [Shimia marina]SFD88127.1 hypothetical protein SAMN04488037_10358 [Shimia marina]
MPSSSYPISYETEKYIAASIENNKFAIVFAGAPFLSVFLFTSLNVDGLELETLVALAIGASGLFLTLVYSMYRLVTLHRYRALVLSALARGERGEMDISRSPAWLSVLPGVALFIGYGSSFFALIIQLVRS